MYVCLYEKIDDNIGKITYYNRLEYAQKDEIDNGIQVEGIPENTLQMQEGKMAILLIDLVTKNIHWELQDIPIKITPEQQKIKDLESQLLIIENKRVGGIL